MRARTWGTGDLTRMSDEQRACGEMRGFATMHESAVVATGIYSIFEFARATQRPISFRIWVNLFAVGGGMRYFDVEYFDFRQVTSSARLVESDVHKKFLQPIWILLNEHVGRTHEQVLDDQVSCSRTRGSPLLRCTAPPPRPPAEPPSAFAPQIRIFTSAAGGKLATLHAMPIMFELTGSGPIQGSRPDMIAATAEARAAVLQAGTVPGPGQPTTEPPCLGSPPDSLQPPTSDEREGARERSLARAERRETAAIEKELQLQLLLEQAPDEHEDAVAQCHSDAKQEVERAHEWLATVQGGTFDDAASVPISPKTHEAVSGCTEHALRERSCIRELLELGATTSGTAVVNKIFYLLQRNGYAGRSAKGTAKNDVNVLTAGLPLNFLELVAEQIDAAEHAQAQTWQAVYHTAGLLLPLPSALEAERALVVSMGPGHPLYELRVALDQARKAGVQDEDLMLLAERRLEVLKVLKQAEAEAEAEAKAGAKAGAKAERRLEKQAGKLLAASVMRAGAELDDVADSKVAAHAAQYTAELEDLEGKVRAAKEAKAAGTSTSADVAKASRKLANAISNPLHNAEQKDKNAEATKASQALYPEAWKQRGSVMEFDRSRPGLIEYLQQRMRDTGATTPGALLKANLDPKWGVTSEVLKNMLQKKLHAVRDQVKESKAPGEPGVQDVTAREPGMLPGWVCRLHTTENGRSYKSYHGPNGETAPSRPKMMEIAKGGGTSTLGKRAKSIAATSAVATTTNTAAAPTAAPPKRKRPDTANTDAATTPLPLVASSAPPRKAPKRPLAENGAERVMTSDAEAAF